MRKATEFAEHIEQIVQPKDDYNEHNVCQQTKKIEYLLRFPKSVKR